MNIIGIMQFIPVELSDELIVLMIKKKYIGMNKIEKISQYESRSSF